MLTRLFYTSSWWENEIGYFYHCMLNKKVQSHMHKNTILAVSESENSCNCWYLLKSSHLPWNSYWGMV